MSPRRGPGRAALVLALALAGPAGSVAARQATPAESRAGVGAAAQADAIPYPALTDLEPQVRTQLEKARRDLEQSLAAAPASPAGDEARGRAYLQMGRLYLTYHLRDAAIAVLTRAAEAAPELFEPEYYLAVARQENGENEAAAAAFRRALATEAGASWPKPAEEGAVETWAVDGRPAAAWLRLGQVELEEGNLSEAADAFRRAVAEPGTAAAAHFGLGRIAAAEGRFEAAVESFEAALALQPDASAVRYPLALAYRRLGDAEAAKRELALRGSQEVSARDPLIRALDDLRQGVALDLERAGFALREQRFADAEGHFRSALATEPQNTAAIRGLAEAEAGQGKNEAARATYRRLLELTPDDASGHYGLGTLLLEDGRAEEATTRLRRAVELAPEVTAARLNLATALARLGRLEEAEAAFARVLEAEPDDVAALRGRGLALANLGRGAEAVEVLRRLIAAEPDDLRGRYELGTALLGLGRAEEGRRELAAVLAAPGAPPPLAARAHVALAEAGLAPGAEPGPEVLAHLEQAVELAPAFPVGHLALARARIAAGRCAEARGGLETALARLPQEGELAHLLARVLAACPAAEARDGEAALALALRVFQALPNVEHAETVALALAELGRYTEAEEWQNRALGEARRTGAGEAVLALLEERLALYRQGRPWRMP